MTEKRDPKSIPFNERRNYTSEGVPIPYTERRSPWGPVLPGKSPFADQSMDDKGFGVPEEKKK